MIPLPFVWERDFYFLYFLVTGKLVTNNTRPYIKTPSKIEGILIESDHLLSYEEDGEIPPFEGIDADTLEGPNSSYFATADHTHSVSQITDLADWAKQPTKPTYTYSEVGAAAASHTHNASQITAGKLGGLVTAMDNINVTQQAVRNIYAGTADLTAGSSTLATGVIYLVYE